MVVSYRNSTSNHNVIGVILTRRMLYLIEILHQTTTGNHAAPVTIRLYLIEILHQTTTFALSVSTQTALYLIEILHQTTTAAFSWLFVCCCILSKFYIKPQPETASNVNTQVVSYRNSTSNHNVGPHID